jgi:hypothetical protein
MSTSRILEFEQLKHITGYSRRADVEKTLRAQGIRVFHGRCGPWTTVDLINKAGGINAAENDNYSPEII